MFFLFPILLLASAGSSLDYVLFSNQNVKSTNFNLFTDVELMPNTQTVIFSVKNFSLASFNQYIGAYAANSADTPLVSWLKTFKSSSSVSADEPFHVSNTHIAMKFEEIGLEQITLFESASLEDLESKFTLTSALSNDHLVVVFTDPEEVALHEAVLKRQKRVSVDDGGGKQRTNTKTLKQSITSIQSKKIPMPVVLPPTGTDKKCLLYLETLVIGLFKRGGKVMRTSVESFNNEYNWDSSYVECDLTAGNVIFRIDIEVNNDTRVNSPIKISRGQNVALTLAFRITPLQTWKLEKISTNSDFLIESNDPSMGSVNVPKGKESGPLQSLGVESIIRFSYACSATKTAFIALGGDLFLGVGFNNFQVGLNARAKVDSLVFGGDVSDCVGFFSAGSWMGIICSSTLAGILLFALLMLQSVQTHDRFDDARQKGYTINFKE